jgi:hypothetical protein
MMDKEKYADNHIIIGLGGTGGNAIKILRQQIVDKYGDVDNANVLKNIDFLYVDSKKSEFDDEKWEYQGKSIKLKGNSTLLMRAGILNELLEDYSSRPAFLGNDSDWGAIRNDRDLASKAGNQMRKLGRVNLIPNINEIVDRVASMQKRLSADSSSKTLIHIVTGLAGGTGSGSIIDVTVQLIKKFEEGSIDVNVNLYLKLPELSIPQGWGGVYAGVLQGVSFYQLNGYAALKEINALANGYFNPYDITTKRQRINTDTDKKDKLIQAAYIITEKNDAKLSISDVISPIASLLFLKTITSQAKTTQFDNQSLTQLLSDVDTNENTTINPESWWQLAAKFPVPGIYKIGVPKVQIRESFAQLLVLHTFNKLLYKNYDESGGDGYLGIAPTINEPLEREKNQIITNLRSALLDEWYLTFDYLVLDEPMTDMAQIGLLTKERDDYSFKTAFKKEYSKQYQLIYQNNIFKGKAITDKEKMKCLQMALNDYFNKDYKGFGYERYYSNKLENVSKISDFIGNRIKDKMFGKNGGKFSRYYPLNSYIDILETLAQEYIDNLERNFKNKQIEYTKLVKSTQEELKTINEEFISSFGIFGSSSKREKTILNFNDTLEKFWYYTITLKGITFGIQLVHSHLQGKLLDIKKEIENDIHQIENRRNVLNQEYLEEIQKLNNKEGVKGFASITDDEGLKKFQVALMKNKDKFTEVITRLESLIFEHKDKVFMSVKDKENKDLPIMKAAYDEIDYLLSGKNFRDLLGEEDQFYNAHIVDVIYNKFDRDIKSPKLKDLLIYIEKMSSPMALFTNTKKGSVQSEKKIILLLPQLQGTKDNGELLDFYNKLKHKIKDEIQNCIVIEVEDEEFKNEITVAQFQYKVFPDMLDSVEKLKVIYDKFSSNHELNFLMHTEDVSNLVDLIPAKNAINYKESLLPYLMIMNTMENSFQTYGDNGFWKITEKVNLISEYETTNSKHEGEEIDIFLECNDIDVFMALDFQKLEKKNTYRKETTGFISPFIYTAIKKRAVSFIDNEEKADTVVKKLDEFLDKCLIEAKNDSSNPRYVSYKNAFIKIKKIIISLN